MRGRHRRGARRDLERVRNVRGAKSVTNASRQHQATTSDAVAPHHVPSLPDSPSARIRPAVVAANVASPRTKSGASSMKPRAHSEGARLVWSVCVGGRRAGVRGYNMSRCAPVERELGLCGAHQRPHLGAISDRWSLSSVHRACFCLGGGIRAGFVSCEACEAYLSGSGAIHRWQTAHIFRKAQFHRNVTYHPDLCWPSSHVRPLVSVPVLL